MMSRGSSPERDLQTIAHQALAASYIDAALFAINRDRAYLAQRPMRAALQPLMAATTRRAVGRLRVSARPSRPEHTILSVR